MDNHYGQPTGYTAELLQTSPAPIMLPAQAPFGLRMDQWLTARRDLALKKSKARTMVKRVVKNGVNESEGYAFVEAADIDDLMRPILDECMLGFEIEYISKRTERAPSGAPVTDVDMMVTYMDLETGYFEQKTINGTGLDYGDKGVYKAYTGARKYALIMEFMIPTGGNDPAPGAADAEKDARKGQESPPESPQASKPTTAGKRTAKAQDKPQEGQEPPITSEQVGKIKVRVMELNQFPNQPVEVRTKGMKATYMSLSAKLKIKDLSEELLETLTEGQAAQAVQFLDEWMEKKRQVDERNTPQQGGV